ncbi:uncharacterized protein LOC119670750 [Teleopsis dalmanni]|uniref:uncharacterized protein LOC119670750 n=1 Tax=Teleopsis dalmanni TaxID=139649 RepID=UPI0018CC802D|nr:uncharacterized protein LOC119670750 [Teleopsis dalmanni]
MPQISPDSIEILNPVAASSNTNTLTHKNTTCSICPTTETIPENESLINLRSTVLPTQTAAMDRVNSNGRERSVTIGEQDMDQSIINGINLDAFHGYKRELDHR